MSDNRIWIKEAIVVEGKDDQSALSRAVDAEIIVTHGFGLSAQTFRRIKTAQKRTGVIIFTDPDRAGENIRRKIDQIVPGCLHAFLPLEDAVLEGDIGIENASPESLRRALAKVRTRRTSPREVFSRQDLIEGGLSGGADASGRRSALGKRLGIGYGNAKRLLARLNHYEITREEFEEALRALNDC